MRLTLLTTAIIFAVALAACSPAATPTAELPTPAVSTAPAEEAMPEEPTEVMEEATEAMPEATEMMEEPTEVMEEPTEAMEEEPAPAMLSGAFVKEEVAVTGTYSLDPATGHLTFSDDFSVSPGPDLFVILSGASDLTVDYQTFSNMVVSAPMLSLAPLTSDSGGQSYMLPGDADLSQYNTVVIWCQSFSVAFAAAPLAQ